MCRLIETISIEGGKLNNIEFHNERYNRSRKELFGIQKISLLEDFIILPSDFPLGKIKCRVIYSTQINSISFSPYTIRKLRSLQIVEDNNINYAFKFQNRKELENLTQSRRADDILIVKNGFITDTSYANIVFWDGVKWITPASPLLCGTMRSKLLLDGKIQCDELQKSDLSFFKSARIINAMISLEESPSIPMKNIT